VLDLSFSDVFGVQPAELDQYGAVNISLVSDVPLFVDPFLLFHSANPKYRALHDEVIRYLAFLRDKAAASVLPQGHLRGWYMFPEVRQTWLGFSRLGNAGSGLGEDFARSLHRNLQVLFTSFGSETVTSGTHLEKLCLIKDGVGRDNISDFVSNLIKGYLVDYTEAFAREHVAKSARRQIWVERIRFNYSTEAWEREQRDLPVRGNDYVLLTPRDLLTRDETWINRPELVDRFQDFAIAVPDEQLRAEINNYLQRQIPKHPTRNDYRNAVSRTIEKYPVVVEFYIRDREEHGDEALEVSRGRVDESRKVFEADARQLAALLRTETVFYALGLGTLEDARVRVEFLKDVIENKGGHRCFWRGEKRIAREEDIQLMFRLTWYATEFDVTREANDGRGPVDFKISKGARDKTLVEFKLGSNSQLRKNLEKQVEIYKKASDARQGLKVIVCFTESEQTRVNRMLKQLGLTEDRDIVLIDARRDNKPSGSKA